MDPEDREFVVRSMANLWSFQALFISHLFRSARDEGVSREALERLLQRIDSDIEVLEGEDDRAHATGLLAAVRTLLDAP